MFREQSETFKYSFIVFDFVMSLASFAVAFAFRFVVLDPSLGDLYRLEIPPYLYLGALLGINQIISFLVIDLYHPRRILSLGDEIMSIIGGVGLSIVLTLTLLFFFRAPDLSRILVVYFGMFNILGVATSHVVIRRSLRSMRAKGYNLRTVLILGGGTSGQRIYRMIKKNPIYGFQIKGFLVEGPEELEPEQSNLGTLSRDLGRILEEVRPNVVIAALEETHPKALPEILELCDLHGADLKIVPGFSSLITAAGKVETMEGLPIISIREVPARQGFNRVVKRIFDLTAAGLFVLVFSPVFLLIALLVKLTSKGPVLFRQERVGLDGRKFLMLKFRSMYTQEVKASDTLWTTKNDPRVTPVGRFIRKTSLDELPQFFNVLSGEMSIVGPRPERPHYVEQFKEEIQSYMRRHAVKAGITGWAQINGLRGDTSIADRIEADIYYIENWSFLLDLKIVLLTPFKGFIDQNAY